MEALRKPGSIIVTPLAVTSLDTRVCSTENIVFVEGLVRGRKHKRVHMVEKEPFLYAANSICIVSDENNAERYAGIWLKLKQEDFPVVSTLRIISDSKIMMTDITRNGGGIYGKYEALQIDESGYEPQVTDDQFQFLNIDAVMREAALIEQQANNRDICLPIDDPFALLVRQDGSYKVMMLDIGTTLFNMKNPKFQNAHAVFKFLTWIQDIRTLLDKQKPDH